VEDNPADAALVHRALEEHGVEGGIDVFTDGEKAIQFIQALDAHHVDCPDLIIIDLNLPKRPGLEVLESVRLSVRCHKLPVVIFSSSDERKDRTDARLLGATWYLRKPLRLEEFLSLGAIFKEILGTSKA